MILLNIETILFLDLIISVICSLIVVQIFYLYRKHYTGIFFWVIGSIFNTISLLLILLRNSVPDWISIVFANILGLVGLLLVYIGLERFMNKKSSQIHNYILITLFAAVHSYFTFFKPDMTARIINLSVIMILLSVQVVWLVFKRLESFWRRLAINVGTVFLVYILINLIRIVCLSINSIKRDNIFQLGNFDAIMMFAYALLLLILAYSFLFMASKRLFMENTVQEEKFNKAFHSSPNAIIITRKSDGKIIEVNEGFENMMGYSHNEVMGKTTFELKIWAYEEDRKKILNELAKNHRISEAEFSFRKKNGKLLPALYFADSIKINDELYILATAVDLTQVKKNEEVLKETKKKLEETLEDFYTLRIGMSNELKKRKLDAENKVIRKRIDILKKVK